MRTEGFWPSGDKKLRRRAKKKKKTKSKTFVLL